MTDVEVVRAREHNLKNVSVSIPKKKLVVFTGVSGSGKSSLVFDTIYQEAQRQLIETFSSFARRRLPKISRPDVDEIRNISTAIIIDQKKLGANPRSTVGTVTELYTYLRLLFSRSGEPLTSDSRAFGFNNPYGMCPVCKGIGNELKIDIDALLDYDKSINEGGIRHPHFQPGMASYRVIVASNYFDLDKKLRDFTKDELDKLLYTKKSLVENPMPGQVYRVWYEGVVETIQRRSLSEVGEASVVSSKGLRFYKSQPCKACNGSRINEFARSVKLYGKTIPELVEMEFTELLPWLEKNDNPIAEPILLRMLPIIQNLVDIGVGYLNLNRSTGTLSGGESQRVKMASQLGCDLVDLIYIFDEPTIGLHQKDIGKLVDMLKRLKEKDNSLFVVEHDPQVMQASDWIIDIGPGAGSLGGNIVFEGKYSDLLKSDSITGKMLTQYTINRKERRKLESWLSIKNANIHNLKNLNVEIPTKVFCCITGVAGSGKSTLILDHFARDHPEAIVIDQSPIGRSIRSNPATYTKVFDIIRQEFASATGKSPSLFSFNGAGACPKCKGAGRLQVEMFFLEDVSMTCDECEGHRYRDDVLELKYRGKSIVDVLQMTVTDAIEFFENKEIKRRLSLLEEVGLGYLQLGQEASSLSGGEAQRLKLGRELNKHGNIYILDEPTTGLHMADITKLLHVINRLVDGGNTLIVIEHNLDIIKNADWVIDMGPEGGSKGGEIIALGTPEQVAQSPKSYTGEYLRLVLK
ncbi:excinuclease ABC subunit UvrA [Candidatus Bathyarchaeota archaeon]|nr:excinuclease ABC subunit UvrA [Candidatus Bathyarchaeota archaeon]